MNIRIEEKLILESLYENDRPLSTTELKSSTGVGTDAIGYSVREKLKPERIIEYWYEERQGTETRVHELTDHGRAEIERGLIGDIFDNDSADPERVALEARIDELEEQLDAYENKIDANKQLLHNLRSRVEKIGGVVEENRVRVNGMRWALEEKGIEVVEYVKRVKNGVS